MKKLHLSDHTRKVSLEERLHFARLSREQALQLSDEQKLRYFFSLQISHRKLNVVEESIARHLGPYSDARILTLIGPPGAGKTSFAENAMAARMKATAGGTRPFLLVAAPAHGSVKVPWSGVYRKILESGDEPLIEKKRGTFVEDNRVKTYNATTRTLDTLRSAVESMLLHRQTKLLAIDEVLHLLRFGDKKALMDTLKSLADATDSQLLLIGSYDLFSLVTSYAQVGRRSEVFYLDRYRRYTLDERRNSIENNDDINEFSRIIVRLQQRWPLDWVPNFVTVAKDLLDATLGIVGLLKDFMYQCLALQLMNDGKWSSSFVRKSLKPASVIKGIRDEIGDGESQMEEKGYEQFSIEKEVLDAIGSGLESA
jgi:AAA domain